MRGEDLQGLNIEELQQLEKMLEVGLSRVLETKVSLYLVAIFFLHEKHVYMCLIIVIGSYSN